MRKILGSLFSAKSSAADGIVEGSQNGLKAAFQRSRVQGNIDVVWPVLKVATLYVVVAPTDQGEQWFLTRSPNPERCCVTVAEQPDSLSTVPWPKRRILGLDLVQAIGPAHEIVVVYQDGGDYVTSEQLAWYRQLG
jgi:fimbrial chaperone protein